MKYEFTIGDTKVVIEGEAVVVSLQTVSVAPAHSSYGVADVELGQGIGDWLRRNRTPPFLSGPPAPSSAARPRTYGVAAVREWVAEKHGRGSTLTSELGLSSAALYTWKRIPSKRAAAISKITGISLGRLLREAPAKPEMQAAE